MTTRLVHGRTARWSILTSVLLTAVLIEPAFAAATVSRAEVSGTRLRLEGTALASRDITVDGVIVGRSDAGGAYRIERDPFTSPADCTIDVNDGSPTAAVARLTGCTVTTTVPPPAGDTIAPSAPGNLTASLAGTTANLSWTASTDNVGVTGYRVTRNGTALAGTVTGTTFADSALAAGTYAYTVRAVDAAGNLSLASTSASVTVAAVPPPPGDTTAPSAPVLTVALVGTTANLSWSTSTDNVAVTGYTINRNGAFHTTALNTFYNGTNLTPGTYTYTVAAMDGAGNISAASNSVSVTVPQPPATDVTAPTVPTGLVTTVVGSTVGVSWNLSTDDTAVTGYRLTRNGVLRATTTDTTYQDLGLAAGTYTYTVVAFDAAGNTSAASASVAATVLAPEALGFITPARLPDATVGQAYLGYIVSTDPPGVSSFRFKLVSGRVPPGTSFSGNTLPIRPEARVTGTPTTVGTSTFTVEVSDGTGATARRTFTIVVVAAPALVIPSGVNVLDPATVGVSYSGILPVSGGGPLQTWVLTAGTLPPGLALGVGVVWGIPTTVGTSSFTARVTDNLGATATGQFSITVS